MEIDLQSPSIVALELMITETLKMQNRMKERMRDMSMSAWNNEFATIRFCMARRTGHTTAGLYLANKLFEYPTFLCHSHSAMTYVKHMANRLDLPRLESRIRTNPDSLIGLPIDGLFVDCSSFAFSEAKKDKIAEIFKAASAPFLRKCLVFLQ